MKKLKILLSIYFALSLTACKDMLDTEPRQSIDSGIALTTATGVNALLNSVYAGFQGANNYGTNRIILPEILADNVVNTTTNNNTWRTQETNNPGTGTGSWADNYTMILRCNLVIDAVDGGGITDAGTAQNNMFKGEALFFRALAYFQLATSYGYLPGKEVNNWKLSVPIITKATKVLQDVEYPERATNTQVYDLIKADLAASINLLTNNVRTDKGYVSKAAAQALLSRVSLYLDDYPATIANATAVLGTNTINTKSAVVAPTGTDLVNMWRQASNKSESIWEIIFLTADNLGVSSLNSWYTIFPKPVSASCTGQPARSSRGDLALGTNLLNAYAATDIRRTQLIEGPYCKGTAGYFFSNKFSGSGGAFGLDNVMVLRMSEQLLNRAEAYAKSTPVQLGNAVADLNVIRQRAGLAPYVLTTQAALIAEILLQRRLELAFEGHRWFDLIRNGQDIPKSPGLSAVSSIPYSDNRLIGAIPAAQIDANKKLVQNPGY